MTFKQLEYFAAVARTLSFTEAANEVYVSQPALSRGIVSLENELGVSLLNRNHHTVSLTPAGTLLASELPDLRKELDRVITLVRQTENGLMGRLNIGVLEEQQLDEVMQVTFNYFAQSLPLVEFTPVRMEGRDLLDELNRNRLDIIFSMDFGISDSPDLDTLQLDSVPFCMIVPPDHRLAGRTPSSSTRDRSSPAKPLSCRLVSIRPALNPTSRWPQTSTPACSGRSPASAFPCSMHPTAPVAPPTSAPSRSPTFPTRVWCWHGRRIRKTPAFASSPIWRNAAFDTKNAYAPSPDRFRGTVLLSTACRSCSGMCCAE